MHIFSLTPTHTHTHTCEHQQTTTPDFWPEYNYTALQYDFRVIDFRICLVWASPLLVSTAFLAILNTNRLSLHFYTLWNTRESQCSQSGIHLTTLLVTHMQPTAYDKIQFRYIFIFISRNFEVTIYFICLNFIHWCWYSRGSESFTSGK